MVRHQFRKKNNAREPWAMVCFLLTGLVIMWLYISKDALRKIQ